MPLFGDQELRGRKARRVRKGEEPPTRGSADPIVERLEKLQAPLGPHAAKLVKEGKLEDLDRGGQLGFGRTVGPDLRQVNVPADGRLTQHPNRPARVAAFKCQREVGAALL